MSGIKAVIVDKIWSEDAPPGAIKYFDDIERRPDGFNFRCPCGCGGIGSVSFAPEKWTWDGNREQPTVKPSIYFERGAPGEWHGFLTAGTWVKA